MRHREKYIYFVKFCVTYRYLEKISLYFAKHILFFRENVSRYSSKALSGAGILRHCHHPRNCLYFLRNEEVDRLQRLLQVCKDKS